MCYAVDVCNWFSWLPRENVPVMELSVDQISVNPVDYHFIKTTECTNQEGSVFGVVEEAPIPLMRCRTK